MSGQNMQKIFIILLFSLGLFSCSGEQTIPQGDQYIDNVSGIEFLLIPGGCYQMGINENDVNILKEKIKNDILTIPGELENWGLDINDEVLKAQRLNDAIQMRFNALHGKELPCHEVCVDSFFMSKYEVTQEQYLKITHTNPSKSKIGMKHPVESLSWMQAVEFTEALSKQSQYKFRLPTEAEWEYAARGNTSTVQYLGNSITCTDAMFANREGELYDMDCREIVSKQGLDSESTAPVGSYEANPYGLYDMLGNVSELCLDGYHSDMYANSSRTNPIGKESTSHVHRGGSWRDRSENLRSASRDLLIQDYASHAIGFRIVLPNILH